MSKASIQVNNSTRVNEAVATPIESSIKTPKTRRSMNAPHHRRLAMAGFTSDKRSAVTLPSQGDLVPQSKGDEGMMRTSRTKTKRQYRLTLSLQGCIQPMGMMVKSQNKTKIKLR